MVNPPIHQPGSVNLRKVETCPTPLVLATTIDCHSHNIQCISVGVPRSVTRAASSVSSVLFCGAHFKICERSIGSATGSFLEVRSAFSLEVHFTHPSYPFLDTQSHSKRRPSQFCPGFDVQRFWLSNGVFAELDPLTHNGNGSRQAIPSRVPCREPERGRQPTPPPRLNTEQPGSHVQGLLVR